MDMSKRIDKVPSLLHLWYAGQEGGTAVAEILFGKVNPVGNYLSLLKRNGKIIRPIHIITMWMVISG